MEPSAVVPPNLVFSDLLGMPAKLFRAHRLAGFRPADFDDVLADGVALELVIERHDAIDFGARQVQRACDDGKRRLGHVAELVLQVVENFEKLIWLVAVPRAGGERRDFGGRRHRTFVLANVRRCSCNLLGHAGRFPGVYWRQLSSLTCALCRRFCSVLFLSNDQIVMTDPYIDGVYDAMQ